MKCSLFVCLFCLTFVKSSDGNRTCGVQPVFRSTGDLRLAMIVNECQSSSLSNTIVLSSAWLCERLNLLEVFGELKIGADIYKTCNVEEMIDPVVDADRVEGFSLGVITWKPVPRKIRALSVALNVPVTTVPKHWKPLVTATVGLLSAFHWNENVTLVTDDPDVLQLFFHESRKEWICVKSIRSFRETSTINYIHPVIIFGKGDDLNVVMKNITHLPQPKLIIVPLDGSQIEGLPDGAYILQPLYADVQHKITKSPKIIPSPVLLNIATSVINIAKNVSRVLAGHCNQTGNDLSCLKTKFATKSARANIPYTTQREVLRYLKIEPLTEKFIYNIYKVEHLDLLAQKMNNGTHNTTLQSDVTVLQTFIKVGNYNLFNYTLVLDELYIEDDNITSNDTDATICSQNHRLCFYECANFKSPHTISIGDEYLIYNIVLKQDPWILATLSVATLGVLFCIAILIFIFVRLCKKDIFEGNPVLSVLLLLTLTVMYASVVPFALEVTAETEFKSTFSEYICLARSLAVTMSYSSAFSLMLSRCVMLATVAYEAGFMSHITGHVQSLLCLFMIAVQGALSIQSIENCQDLFSGNTFLYVLSYDILLLGLLLCSAPFVFRSQRNYKEGRYFAIAIILVSAFWVAWLSAFVLVEDRWKMTVVCSGLLGTASMILGAVFIPRTYLMTSAVVRDNLTSALPSLAFASSTSVLDLNYSNAQHVYDCVNIATINAANMAQPMSPAVPQCNPNFYSDEPGLETTEINANNPPCDSPDKVTRF